METLRLCVLYLMSIDGVERGICEFNPLREHVGFVGFVGLLVVDCSMRIGICEFNPTWWCSGFVLQILKQRRFAHKCPGGTTRPSLLLQNTRVNKNFFIPRTQ